MIDRTWISKVESIKEICAESRLPVSVETDQTPDGLDGQILLGDIPFTKTGDVFDVDFSISINYSTAKENYEELLARLMLLSQKLCRDQRHTFQGWERVVDDSKLIYEGLVIVKGIINPDLLV